MSSAGSTNPGKLPFERLGDLRLIRELGRGSTGAVYLAEEEVLGRTCAVKILSPGLSQSEKSLSRFHHEAQITSRLSHPALVPVYRFGNQQSYYYIASGFIDGPTLAEVIADRSSSQRSPQECAAMLAPVAEGLHHAHEHHIVHRDVKPSNILIDRSGQARLSDFGLATDLHDESLTHSGGLMGSVPYMSPEQATHLEGDIDRRSDIFSIGVVLYEFVSGRRPFDGEDEATILDSIVGSKPAPLRGENGSRLNELEIICNKCLEKDRRHRYATAAGLAADLRRFADGKPIATRPPSRLELARRAASRNRRILSVTSMILIAAVAGLIFGLSRVPSGTFPVIIESSPSHATVYVRLQDSFTGEPLPAVEFGTTPLRILLAPGDYRFVIMQSDSIFAELSRTVVDSATSPLRLSTDFPVPHGLETKMVLVDGGPFLAGVEPYNGYPYMEYEVNSFHVDRYETTNAEYVAFLKDTGRVAPAAWPTDFGDDWLKLPAAGVAWADAVAYAESAGKRLLTHLEWERMARGRDGRRFPWGNDAVDEIEYQKRTNCASPTESFDPGPGWYARYLKNSVPPGSFPADLSPEGVFDVLGSLSEWIDTRGRRRVGDEIRISPTDRTTMGMAWLFPPSMGGLDHLTQGPGTEAASLAIEGIRCARSVNPLQDVSQRVFP